MGDAPVLRPAQHAGIVRSAHRELLRRLTLNDESALALVLGGRDPAVDSLIDNRTRTLVRLAGLVALDSETASLQAAVDRARAAGVSNEEIVETVLMVAPIVGATRIGSVAPRLALALEAG